MLRRQSRLIELKGIHEARGSLTFIEAGGCTPFLIERVFYVYGVPAGATRAGHALRTCEQLIVAVAGAFDAVTDAGDGPVPTRLDSPAAGLYVPPMTWLELDHFSPGAVCLVLASEPYSEAAYIRSREELLRSRVA